MSDRQARFSDALELCNQGAREASMQLAGHWLRSYMFHRAQTNYKLGNLDDALKDCKMCVMQFENNHLEDLLLVRCMCLQAAVVREAALYGTPAQSVHAYLDALSLIRGACSIADALAAASGAYEADSNVTYGRSDTAVRRHHMITPVLQSLTELHINEPHLSLGPKFDKRKLHQHLGIDIPSLQQAGPGAGAGGAAGVSVSASMDRGTLAKALGGGGGITTSITTNLGASVDVAKSKLAAAAVAAEENSSSVAQKYKLNSLRLAPLDDKEFVLCESEFSNVYLQENRVLLLCRTMLCQVLDDARNAGMDGNKVFANYYEPNALVNEQLAMAESALKVCSDLFMCKICFFFKNMMCFSFLFFESYFMFFCCFFTSDTADASLCVFANTVACLDPSSCWKSKNCQEEQMYVSSLFSFSFMYLLILYRNFSRFFF
jgi:hypothetical protein